MGKFLGGSWKWSKSICSSCCASRNGRNEIYIIYMPKKESDSKDVFCCGFFKRCLLLLINLLRVNTNYDILFCFDLSIAIGTSFKIFDWYVHAIFIMLTYKTIWLIKKTLNCLKMNCHSLDKIYIYNKWPTILCCF